MEGEQAMSEIEVVEDYVQKVPADQMCWMHLLPLGECECEVVEV